MSLFSPSILSSVLRGRDEEIGTTFPRIPFLMLFSTTISQWEESAHYLGKLRRRSRRTCLRIFYFGVDSRDSGYPVSYATSLSSNYKSLYFPILKSFPLGRFKTASVSLISAWLEWILQWKEKKRRQETRKEEWRKEEERRRGTKLPSWCHTAKQTRQYASSLILHALNLLRRAVEILKCQELWLQASLPQHPRVPIMQIT